MRIVRFKFALDHTVKGDSVLFLYCLVNYHLKVAWFECSTTVTNLKSCRFNHDPIVTANLYDWKTMFT